VVALIFFIGSFAPMSAYSDGSYYGSLEEDWGMGTENSLYVTDQEGYLTKANPQTGNGDRSSVNDYDVYTVAGGDTVSTIAQSYGLKTNSILWANGMGDSAKIRAGQQLLIPPRDGISHLVAKNDNVEKIAKTYGVNANEIIRQNDLTDGALTVNESIFIPGGKPLVVETPNNSSKGKLIARATTARVASSSRAYSGPVDGAILKGTDAAPAGSKIFIFPTRGKITNGYHPGHYAFDIADTSRPAVWAAGGGSVVKVLTGCGEVSYKCGGGYGNHIIIDHGNGLQTLYGHLQYPTVKVGDRVSQGDVIGKMGRSGNVRGRTGIHLHFEVHKGKLKLLPSNYF
jgi:murein DD-endopeptidase MepM/ murein hydrolase activator NlpD